MTGLLIVGGAVVLALAFGLYRRATDGRARAVATATRLTAGDLGADLGDRATFVQFSTAVCAPCRTTRAVLGAVAAGNDDVVHVDVDAESRLELVVRFDVTRTPTVLVLDGDGVVRHRIVGAPRRADVLGALAALAA